MKIKGCTNCWVCYFLKNQLHGYWNEVEERGRGGRRGRKEERERKGETDRDREKQKFIVETE